MNEQNSGNTTEETQRAFTQQEITECLGDCGDTMVNRTLSVPSKAQCNWKKRQLFTI
jgi:hypothetical protein